MAAGEYVSVSSQADTEEADLSRERRELRAAPARELEELRQIYVARGLDPELALRVANQLTERDALAARRSCPPRGLFSPFRSVRCLHSPRSAHCRQKRGAHAGDVR